MAGTFTPEQVVNSYCQHLMRKEGEKGAFFPSVLGKKFQEKNQ